MRLGLRLSLARMVCCPHPNLLSHSARAVLVRQGAGAVLLRALARFVGCFLPQGFLLRQGVLHRYGDAAPGCGVRGCRCRWGCSARPSRFRCPRLRRFLCRGRRRRCFLGRQRSRAGLVSRFACRARIFGC